MQNSEAAAFLARIEQLPTGPGADLDVVLRPSLEDEAELRKLFAQDKGNARLKDPHVGLVDVFSAPPTIRTTRARVVTDENDLSARYVMPLLDEQRRKEGSPAMVQTLDEFNKNWAIFTEGSLSQLLDWNNVIVAGGAVQACLAPVPEKATVSKRALRKHFHTFAYPASDVDLFLYGLTPEQAEVKINTIYEAVRDSIPWDVTCIRTKHTVSIHSQYPYRAVQIVLRLYQSPAEVLAGFDVDAPCCAYDGQRVWANPRAIVAAMRQCNTTDVTRRSPSYEVRLAKYAARDMEIYVPQIRREDIDPTIFERSVVRVQGLARLLVLEKLATPIARDSYVNSRRKLRNRPDKLGVWRRSKVKQYKGDLKDEVNSGLELSDYDVVSLHIPYGPGWDARRIEKLVYQTDLGMNSPYNPKNKGRRLHRHPAFFGTMPECLEDCCENCIAPKNDEERELQRVEDESYIRDRVQFIVEDAGRQSISGSFNPIDEGEWSEQAYMGLTEKFFAAIASHDRPAVSKMIKEGMDVNRRDHVGRTPLQVAVLSKAVDITFDLIDAEARMTSRLVDGRTVLHLAAQLNLPDVVRKLLERSAVNAEAAREAAHKGQEAKKEEEGSIDLEQSDNEGSDSDIEMRDSSEDDWDSEEENGVGAKDDGAEGVTNNDTIPEDETEEPDVFEIDAQDWDHALSPLHYAIVAGSSAAFDLLLASGANAKLIAKVTVGHSYKYAQPLILTSVTEDEDEACRIAEKLLAAGNVSSEADADLATVFHRMVCKSKPKLVSTFLSRDPNAKTVLHVPYMPNHRPVIFPLVSVLEKGCYSILAVLLAHGAKVDTDVNDVERARDMKVKNNQYVQEISSMQVPTPLEAALLNYNQSIHLLVALGADVNAELPEYRRRHGNNKGQGTYLDYVRLVVRKIDQSKQPKPAPKSAPEARILSASHTHSPMATNVSELTHAKDLPAPLVTPSPELPSWKVEVQKIIAICRNTKSSGSQIGLNIYPLDEIHDYFTEVEQLLVASKAKASWELPPSNAEDDFDPHSMANTMRRYVHDLPLQYHHIPLIETFQGPSIQFYRHVGPWGHTTMSSSLIPLYDELFTACHEGDNGKIQQLCMPRSSQKTVDTPLQISVHWGLVNYGFTPLSIAILARKWDTAKLILAIAYAQYSPKEPTQGRFDGKIVSLDGDDDENESDDDDFIDDEEEPIDFVDIANRPSEIRVQVPPSRMINYAIPWVDANKGETTWSGPIDKAIAQDDFEAFVQMLDILCSLQEDLLDTNVLKQLLFLDRPAMLDEYIRRTGKGIDVSIPIDSVEGQSSSETSSSKVYLGLNVHGKKRKDLAAKGDPHAQQDSCVSSEPILWTAILRCATATVRYLASEQPLAAYRFYASSHGDQQAKLIRQLPDLNTAIPALLGWTANALNETPLTAAIRSDRGADMIDMLFTVRASLMQDYLQLRQRKYGFNNVLAAVRWSTESAVFDFLLSKGVSPMESDDEKRNIYHILCGKPEDENRNNLLDYVLEKLPKDVTNKLLRQQDKSSGNTPLHMAVKNKHIRAVKALTETGAEHYLIRDSSGFTPLHVAVILGNATITRLVAEAGPAEALTLEDSVGSTPLEIATYAAFKEKFNNAIARNEIPSVSMLSVVWQRNPFDLAKEEAELTRYKATLDYLMAEGKLVQGTKLWKELIAFSERLEQKVAKEKAKPSDAKKEKPAEDFNGPSETLAALRAALEARPGLRRLVHLSDVHLSVNKGLEEYAGLVRVKPKDEEDEESTTLGIPEPVITGDYEAYLSTLHWHQVNPYS